MPRNLRLLTTGCAYSCLFCHREGVRPTPAPRLSTGELRTIIETAAARGFHRVLKLSGGEPLEVEGLYSIINSVLDLIERYTVVTNGAHLLDALPPSPEVASFHVNIPSFDSETYAFATGQSAVSLAEVLRAIQEMTNLGAVVHANYVLCSGLNSEQAEFAGAIREAESRGLRSLRIIELLPVRGPRKALAQFVDCWSLINEEFLAGFAEVESGSSRKRTFLRRGGDFSVHFIRCSCALPCSACGSDRDLYCTLDGLLLPCMFGRTEFDTRAMPVEEAIDAYLRETSGHPERYERLKRLHVQ